ncbi:sensor histidine kinase [Lewinella sp. IMCC34191]|uniref:sensor histidine kinase n=1 Tax=Lewinella sp. IMCC34191 TaxID=2259172 RepID=UPI000E24E8D6|nr:GAF domain-containing sensor histidine kinase [Lewinella sp. IMCC34191]
MVPIPSDEEDRLRNLREFNILDSLPEDEYNDLVSLAAEICQTPVAQITLVDADRQWYKAEHGYQVPGRQIDRQDGFCAHTILDRHRPLIVSDMRADDRFRNNRFVAGDPHAVFYAGFPLRSSEGFALGSLCVVDLKPRTLTEGQLRALRRLSTQAIKLMELHRSLQVSQARLQEKEYAYGLLKDFSHIVAHDLKAPVRNIRQASEILREDFLTELAPEGAKLFHMIEERAADAARMIDGVLRYSKAARSMDISREWISVPQLLREVIDQVGRPGCDIAYVGSVEEVHSSPIALKHIFQNLIGNAVKFNDKEAGWVKIDGWHDQQGNYHFTVGDNGPGIPPQHLEAIFQIFHSAVDDHRRGHGVGLSIVRRLLGDLGGTISVRSNIDAGATFSVFLPAVPGR